MWNNMMTKINNVIRVFILILILCFFSNVIIASNPIKVHFQIQLADEKGNIQGDHHKLKIGIYEYVTDGRRTPYYRSVWTVERQGVYFDNNGVCNIILGEKKELQTEHFTISNPKFGIEIDDRNDERVYIDIPYTPYAIQAKSAEDVLKVRAETISGTFTNPVVIQNDLVISNNVFMIDATKARVGIGKSNPQYSLDVKGIINAEGFKVNNTNIEDLLAWKRKTNILYYDQGNVGIATANPQYKLDVAGIINADQFNIKGMALSTMLKDALSWQYNGQDIYYTEGNVGIGTSVPLTALDVSGSIRIGQYSDPQGRLPPLGTIQFKDDDFQGFTATGWRSLTSLSGSGSTGQIAYWTGRETIAGTDELFWDITTSRLGVGTANPTAKVEIITTQDVMPLLIKNSQDEVVLAVGEENVGIGTKDAKYKLSVNGTIDANAYTINGDPIQYKFSKGSFWLRENQGRLFYDEGNVGIGTQSPQSLLEIASSGPTINPTLTFGLITGEAYDRLITMGIDYKYPEAFIIAKGGNLDIPVFVFKGEKIGVGLQSPQANLHVSGNEGVVFEGTYYDDTDPDKDALRPELPEKGPGTKLIWYPAKAAFRVGTVENDDWDSDNLGMFSVAMGFGVKALGRGAFVGGGYLNEANGDYAVVPGGLMNFAEGDYSFAAGHKARALHAGSFVWADYTPSLNYFDSTSAGQFIIRANNGVGIGTNETYGSALTIKRNKVGDLLLRTIDKNGDEAFIVNTSGNVGIGTSKLKYAKLAVMGGDVGIGTTQPPATLAVYNTKDNPQPNDLLLAIIPTENLSPGGVATAAVLVNYKGQVGVGVPINFQFGPNDILFVNGGIKGSEFKVFDPNNPDATISLQPNPGSPWSDPSKSQNNTYRTQGRIGIGTPSPNSLLELSNRNINKDPPVITFDLDGTDIFSLGVTANASKEDYLFVMQSGGELTSDPAMTVATGGVGIGLNLNMPTADLHVSGNAVFEGRVVIATTNTNHDIFSLYIDGAMNLKQFYIREELFKLQETPWETKRGTLNIFYNLGNVGIGTDSPLAKLHVVGTIRTERIEIERETQLSGYLTTDELRLKDWFTTWDDPDFGALFVRNSQAYYRYPTGEEKEISSPLKFGTGVTGNMAFWVNRSTLGETTVHWQKHTETQPQKLFVSGNLVVTRTYESGGFLTQASVSMGAPSALIITANLLNPGEYPPDMLGYTAEKIDILIHDRWGNPEKETEIIGLDINIDSAEFANLYADSKAIGLKVDVSDVDTLGGSKYAAVFMGGNVGIGTTRPRAELEVMGTVSANYFNLSEGLEVAELLIAKDSFIGMLVDKVDNLAGGKEARVVIGGPRYTDKEDLAAYIEQVRRGDAELVVNGTVSTNTLLVTQGIRAVTLNINNGAFMVDKDGNIGVGTTKPDGQIEIKKTLTSLDAVDGDIFTSEKIDLTIDGTAKEGDVFYFKKNISGLEMNLATVYEENIRRSKLEGNATGIKVDMSNLEIENPAPEDTNKIVGLDIDVSGEGGIRYAAIFQGGFVGIGTPSPDAELHVSGDILANNLRLDGALITNKAQFDELMINQSATFNGIVSINYLVVSETATINRIVLGEDLEAEIASFTTINANIASINQTLKAQDIWTTQLVADEAKLNWVGIGTTPNVNPSDKVRLEVSGSVYAGTIILTDKLDVRSATFNINNTLFIPSEGEKVGIGTSEPQNILDIRPPVTGRTYTPIDNRSWNAIRLQTNSYEGDNAVGIIFAPDQKAPSINIGSGIVALRASTRLNEPGSHLVFITDPEDASPAERMRITEQGNVGIGTTAPWSLLHVNGEALFDGTVTANTLYVKNITSRDSITISPNSLLNVQGMVSINANLLVNGAIYLKEVEQMDDIDNFGKLFVRDSDLFYREPNSTNEVNISAPFKGMPSKIPYYNEYGSLIDTAPLYWNDTNHLLTIGTGNINTRFELVATIDNSVKGGTFTAHRVNMKFADRTAVHQESEFIGLDINFGADTDSYTYGRLADGETAVGLKVDLRKLAARQFDTDGNQQYGFKYAALFLGGEVGIGTSDPEAQLHVVNEIANNIPLRIDANEAYALIVSQNSFIGLGTSLPESQLTIQTKDDLASNSAFKIKDHNDNTIMIVKNDGRIGVGTDTPVTQMEVNGKIKAQQGLFAGIEATTINVGSGSLVVDASGNVGIGTTQPEGNIVSYKNFDREWPQDDYISQRTKIILSGGEQGKPFEFLRNISGIDIQIDSLANNKLGDTSTAYVAKGVNVDLSALNLHSNADAKGIYVDVGDESLGGKRYAAIFQGGNVGIGTSTPEVSLHVSGDIKTHGLYLTGWIQAEHATFNSLAVTQVASFNSNVSVQELYAQTISANNIIINGELTVPTATFKTISGNQGIFNRVGIGKTPALDKELDILGDMQIDGKLIVGNVLELTQITSPGDLEIDLGVNEIEVSGSIFAHESFKSDKAIYIKKGEDNSAPNADSGYGALFVDNAENLLFLKPSGTTINLSALTGTPNTVPYYDSGGNLSSTYMYWKTENSYGPSNYLFSVGTNNVLTTFEIDNNVSSLNDLDFASHRIDMNFANRTGLAGNTIFAGLNINLNSNNHLDDNDFGRIAPGETAIGLLVDVRNLHAKYQTQQTGGPSGGLKYAAIFKGGSVGIGTTQPEAALHIRNEITGNVALRVDTTADGATWKTGFQINGNNNVGIGTSDPTSKLTIKADAINPALEVVDANDNTTMYISQQGNVGFGTNNPSAKLHIVGTANLVFNVDAQSEELKNNAFVLTSEGLVGVGTSLPEALFHIKGDGASKTFKVGIEDVNPDALVIDKLGSVGMGFGVPDTGSYPYDLNVKGIVYSGANSNFNSLVEWLLDDTTKGYLTSQNDDDFTFFGLRESATNTYESVLHWTTDRFFFEAYDGTSTNNVMTLAQNGGIGIGVANPQASLHVSGNLFIEGSDQVSIFTTANMVGIGTTEPHSALDIQGILTTSEFNVLNGDVTISTLNILGQMVVNRHINYDMEEDTFGQIIDLRIKDNIKGRNISGLEIKLLSEYNEEDETEYAIWKHRKAYGLLVDVSGLLPGSIPLVGSLMGHKYAAVFNGGFVGIGTRTPITPLHVYANVGDDLARFGSDEGSMTLHDYGSGQMGFYNININASSTTYHQTMVLAPSDETEANAAVPGRVGIAITEPNSSSIDKALVVNGDIRLGMVFNDETVIPSSLSEEQKYGARFWFSGAADVSDGDGEFGTEVTNENDDPIWIARYNEDVNKTELRVNVGNDGDRHRISDTNPDNVDRFVVGYTDDSFKEVFQVRMDGRVGIWYNPNSIGWSPRAPLHVRGTTSGEATELENHVMIIENSDTTGEGDSLAIYHSGGNLQSGIPTESHFISFFMGGTPVGSIEGNAQSGGGVRFKTSGADYAEYLEKHHQHERIEEGDIVGIYNGKISKNTTYAQQYMVKSSGASVAGNYPGKNKEYAYELISFFGQVPIKVLGKVKLDDYILPSGLNDGTGIAKSPDKILPEEMNKIVGRAWESSNKKGVKLIRAAVGFAFSMPKLQKQLVAVNNLKNEIQKLKKDREQIVNKFEEKLEKQNQEINELFKALSAGRTASSQ
jgi:cytoskeletal protein CcmA (bactofilin family)